MFGRKVMPESLAPAWEAFSAQASRVASARSALLRCLPVGRVDPAPVPVGLDLLRDELEAVRAELDAWKVPEVAAAWQACADAVEESLDHIDDARSVAESSAELEELLDAVSDVAEPLAVWGDAERDWLKLRVRP